LLVANLAGKFDTPRSVASFNPGNSHLVELCVAIRNHVSFSLRTIGNLVSAIREGDYSVRSREGYQADALGEVMREINALGETLLARRREASAAAALLRSVMTEIEVAVFAFDDSDRLRLANRRVQSF
jgi:two-component system nitrogen regulation sensor histidine kinase NtrY